MDVIVIGGGIAGISIAHELAQDREVLLLEAERSLAMHTTGRSAATWVKSYGPPRVHDLSAASLDWFLNPPIETDGPLTRPMGCLWIGCDADELKFNDLVAAGDVKVLDTAEALGLNPVLRPDFVAFAAYDSEALDLDVAGIHQAYVRSFKHLGGTVLTSAGLIAAKRSAAGWTVTTESGEHHAPVIVNAAGAWGDRVAEASGVSPIGLEPRRRTIFQSTPAHPIEPFPFTMTLDERFYIKPEGDGVICSPVDAELEEPKDTKPDQFAIAMAIDAINEATTLGLRSVRTAWAGQRTFAPGGDPVDRWDAEVEGFFWFVGQGGWGIQMAPALAIEAANKIRAGI